MVVFVPFSVPWKFVDSESCEEKVINYFSGIFSLCGLS
jgi:hypothetical protein